MVAFTLFYHNANVAALHLILQYKTIDRLIETLLGIKTFKYQFNNIVKFNL